MTRVLLTRKFWLDAAERAIKTAAQTTIAAVSTTALVQDLDWAIVGGTVAIATGLSVLTSIASSPIGDPGSASAVGIVST